jgi:hypothetical protein
MLAEGPGDRGLIGFRRRRGVGESNLAQTKVEQPVAPPGLAVVVAFWGSPGEDVDLPIVQSEAALKFGNLRLKRPFVRQE